MGEARGSIAVIDDDSVFIELMQDLLGDGEGYDIISCPNWVESFEFIRDEQPDLVILDLMMGREQTGWAVLHALRENPATASIPVILCSAAAPAMDGQSRSLNGSAAVETVSKPFDVDHLLGVIARLLELRAPQSAI